jgi:hypothetical protein
MGRLDLDKATHGFVYVPGALRVFEFEGDPRDEEGAFMGLFDEIESSEESEPRAAFGWLSPDTDGATLSLVGAISNPFGAATVQAVEDWASSNGLEVQRPAW